MVTKEFEARLYEEHSLIAVNETLHCAIVDLGPRPHVRPHFFDLA